LHNILSVDFEEWYHPEYVKGNVSINKEERMQHSSKRALRLLEKHKANATFFVVGEIAEKHPSITEKIDEQGHEIGFHGYYHEPLWKSNVEKLRQEVEKFNSLFNGKCRGFRAPSFSLSNKTKWALDALEEAGYIYDSSIFPTKTPLYGVFGAPTKPYRISHENVAKEEENGILWEFPVLTYTWFGLKIPVGGGFYLRTIPLGIIERAIRKMNKCDQPAVIFVHPWELDPGTPKRKLGLYRSYVTYRNIEKTEKKLRHLLSNFSFVSVRNYMENQGFPFE
jgi:polysaccharide deacetylase family protein (PEP-CTERM system associated)